MIPPRVAVAPVERPATAGVVPFPVPQVPAVRPGVMRYGLARIDASGRVADRSIVKTLGWCSGDSLVITVVESAVVVHRDPAGVFAVPAAPYLTLPAVVRRRAGVRAGDQLLVAADATCGVLVIHPLAALDSMLVGYHASLLGGDEHDGRTE
ncbi:hypothetical protein [Amycolatopsis sp. Hca4]|uniref:hypothetical protein n=1 Tax=Amycolatopsis sp. Hca4 TaxID=2742131 RepID=UPI0015922642|nr:hypothetical protein [Amycolatopsis sp. Hca4]QKV73895.1 hypothetical protein HUT10_09015 [Amycolatopsis sp. Hca4]